MLPMAEKGITAVFSAVPGSLQHPDDLLGPSLQNLDDLLRASEGQPALEQEMRLGGGHLLGF